ncbi:MAG TPA: glycerol-3-phosphate 1-O-acyltransferase PlsY [Paenalcaligenes sp.]|nr:glycerol-3-phosphate 1-O-acyltransferase PlsY [Paenalcaligenes sp.]
MTLLALLLLTIIGAYLIGSIPFAVVVSKIMRLPDPRQFGSKNPGATNVLRSGNKAAAALTLLGDVLKGVFAVLIARTVGEQLDAPSLFAAWAGIAVFIGHLYPVFLNFKGGKGVATALGVLAALHPLLAVLAALCWLLVAYTTRYSSLSAIITALFIPVIYVLGAGHLWSGSQSQGIAIVIIAIVLLTRHKANIQRLLKGTESKIGQKQSPRHASRNRRR